MTAQRPLLCALYDSGEEPFLSPRPSPDIVQALREVYLTTRSKNESGPKMNDDTEYPFTAAQFNSLSEAELQAVLAVAEYLSSTTTEITDEDLSMALNLMKPSEGGVPFEEIDTNVLVTVRRKFAAVYQPAMELAQAELKQKGFKERAHFNFCLVIEPSDEDTTHVAVVDYDKPVCYLHEWSKAWHFSFENLAQLAEAVLTAKANLVARVMELCKKEVYVVLEDGAVREVEGLPAGKQVVVVDYNIEDVEKSELTPSPLDGELCKLTAF